MVQTGYREDTKELLQYPVDTQMLLALLESYSHVVGIPCTTKSANNDPATLALFALVTWNQFLSSKSDHLCWKFLTQVQWFIEHEVHIGLDASGWPLASTNADVQTTGTWLSALVQGCSLSVIMRAFHLTHDQSFLEVAHRVVKTFESDILDGGVCSPVATDGIFFEEVAVYPATHRLSGFIFGLLGLYDYVAVTHRIEIKQLIQRSLSTMHELLDEFDLGYWVCTDLLNRRLATPAQLSLLADLLEVHAAYSDCKDCAKVATRWKGYQSRFGSRLLYSISVRWNALNHKIWSKIRATFFTSPPLSTPLRVLVPVPSHPYPGGILTVLEGTAELMKDTWQIEYQTQRVMPGADGMRMHRFGLAKMTPWHFPAVWLYYLAGFRKLISLMHRGAGYHIILPQDGVFTAAFASMAAKMAGVRVVCMDHSSLTWPKGRLYHAERRKTLAMQNWPWLVRVLSQLSLIGYWPSLSLLAWFAARLVDHYLIPGVVGDDIDDICQRLGVPRSRITRFASMIDVDRHIVPDSELRATMREQKGLPGDAIVVAIICRLAPEKGLDIAIESIDQALQNLSSDLRTRVRIIIAGDGPVRPQLEQNIERRKLSGTCTLWGNIPVTEVISLLGISNIFLYTSTRGSCYPMSVLEAMASSCTVIASTQPMSNAVLLANGRGIAVHPQNVTQISAALTRLINDPELCKKMGELARDYIVTFHSSSIFRRTLSRVTYWSKLNEMVEESERMKLLMTK